MLAKVFHSFGKDEDYGVIRADAIVQEMTENASLVKGFFMGYSGRTL